MASKKNFICDQGAFFNVPMTWFSADRTPVNVAGWTAKMQVRDSADAVIVELSTTNGRIVLGGATGGITLKIADTVTATLAAGTYNYDLKMISPVDGAFRLIEGTFTVVEAVTQ